MDMMTGLAQSAAEALPLPSHDDIYYHHQRMHLLDETDEEMERQRQQQRLQQQQQQQASTRLARSTSRGRGDRAVVSSTTSKMDRTRSLSQTVSQLSIQEEETVQTEKKLGRVLDEEEEEEGEWEIEDKDLLKDLEAEVRRGDGEKEVEEVKKRDGFGVGCSSVS
ncbi:hypothetical protein BGW38_009954, partial [Lunasporangiospora selenospora]